MIENSQDIKYEQNTRYIFVALTIFIGILLSIVTFILIRNWEEQKIRKDAGIDFKMRIDLNIGHVIVGSIGDYNPDTHDIIEKYLGAKAGVPTEHQLKLVKLMRYIGSSYEGIVNLHAEGSLAAQKLSIYALADFNHYKTGAKRAARIDGGTKDHVYSELPMLHPELRIVFPFRTH